MLRSQINIINQRLKATENKPLSGGIVGRNIKIFDNGMGQLEVKGDFTITIKVFDLCSLATPKLPALINTTRSFISSLLNVPVYLPSTNYYRYDSKKNKFNVKDPTHFALVYNFKFKVDMYKVDNSAQIAGNDFVIAIVDAIGARFRDKFGVLHNEGGFSNKDAPSIVNYSDWTKNWLLAAHEFFHTLSLDDLEDAKDQNDLMYHLGSNGKTINQLEKADVINYIIADLRNMTKATYQNPGMNTLLKLRQQLNNPANEVRYNRNRFR